MSEEMTDQPEGVDVLDRARRVIDEGGEPAPRRLGGVEFSANPPRRQYPAGTPAEACGAHYMVSLAEIRERIRSLNAKGALGKTDHAARGQLYKTWDAETPDVKIHVLEALTSRLAAALFAGIIWCGPVFADCEDMRPEMDAPTPIFVARDLPSGDELIEHLRAPGYVGPIVDPAVVVKTETVDANGTTRQVSRLAKWNRRAATGSIWTSLLANGTTLTWNVLSFFGVVGK